jgi:hypothetical protein
MTRAALLLPAMLLCLLAVAPLRPATWETDEHRLLADSAFAGVLREVGTGEGGAVRFASPFGFTVEPGMSLWEGDSFGLLCARFAQDDLAPARFQERGQTILQQLDALSAAAVEAGWQASREAAAPVAHPGRNVVASYLLHHLIALRFARLAGTDGPEGHAALLQGLRYEAIALGYLSDAFSASHLLVPRRDALAALHRTNTREAHHFYRTEGAFVVNAAGDAWRTLGDKVLLWYAPAYRHVLDACRTSLREFFLVYLTALPGHPLPPRLAAWAHTVAAGQPLPDVAAAWLAAQDGPAYYAHTHLPTLLLLPMPVSATWSIRSAEVDAHGIRTRKHAPQLRDPGLHDPDLQNIDPEFLYAAAALPGWIVPDVLRSAPPEELIRSHPDVASVRFIQERDFSPSYKGPLLRMGVSLTTQEGDLGASLGAGYGLWDNLQLLRKVSLNATVTRFSGDAPRTLLTGQAGLSLPFGVSPLTEAVRLELGYAYALPSPADHGAVVAVGLETATLPLGFTYAGTTLRLMYRWIHTRPSYSGPALELVLH